MSPTPQSRSEPALQASAASAEFEFDDFLIKLASGRLPPEAEVADLLIQNIAIGKTLSTLSRVSVPKGASLHVVGDLHGQLPELLTVLSLCGLPEPGRNYLVFNGDFVDRGPQSVEIMIILLSLKLAFPDCVYLNRGNHETRAMNRAYGFEKEVLLKYSSSLFHFFLEVFRYLPLATLINDSVLVLHGGLFRREGVTLADIEDIDRTTCFDRRLPGMSDLAREIMWSDPQPTPGLQRSPRGAGVLFGPDVTEKFCEDNDLLCIIRSHEVMPHGYRWHHDRRCLTVFSAANYVGHAGNLGAVCHIRPSGDGRLAPSDLTLSTFSSSGPKARWPIDPAGSKTKPPLSRL
eukprot:TRINITY_DN63763_c0_g1_i1.p1 TRINITY_DN63763_c0_g1~~TRINITY_DN63763_c0_g1_i1.p1  ORF type:complete len:347 (-),score=41.52 TRINITY_DN63763_c0_g1_i1:59-1099(-)